MVTTAKTKALYAAIVLLVQIYLVYAATLYVEVGSAGFLCVVCAAAASAVGAGFYVFVLANKGEVGGRDGRVTLEERHRIG
jgi:hypothetical protein